MLQWGHRLSAMETPKYSPQEFVADLFASMGPPPFGDGNLLNVQLAVASTLASMGPPPFGDGNSRKGAPSCHR